MVPHSQTFDLFFSLSTSWFLEMTDGFFSDYGVCAMWLCIWVGSPGACDSVKGLFQKDVCLWRPLTNEWCVCTFSTSSEKEMMMTSSYPKKFWGFPIKWRPLWPPPRWRRRPADISGCDTWLAQSLRSFKKKHRLYLPSIELVRINRGHKLQSLSSKRKNTRPFSFEAWRKAESHPLDENDARKRAF